MFHLSFSIALLLSIGRLAVQTQPSRSSDVGGERQRPRLIGLVELPRVWGSEGDLADPRKRLTAEPLDVYLMPEDAAALVARVSDPDQLETREHGYEETSAVAYGAERGWYRIGLRGGQYGWISPRDTGAFRPIETLLLEGLTHVTKQWNPRIADEPSSAAPARRAPVPANDSVNVLETRLVGKDLWLRIAILNPGHCEAVDSRIVATGWVLAYAPSGEPTVWFHSRGC
jgi:hypothetical protein